MSRFDNHIHVYNLLLKILLNYEMCKIIIVFISPSFGFMSSLKTWNLKYRNAQNEKKLIYPSG